MFENLTLNNITALNSTLQYEEIIISPYNMAEIVLCCLILITNIPLMSLILYHRILRKRKENQIFINVQITHVLHSCHLLATKFVSSPDFFYIYAITTQGLMSECLLSMSLLTYERFYVIYYHISPPSKVVEKTVPIIYSSWALPIVFIALSLYFELPRLQYAILCTVLVVVIGVGLAIANIQIYRTAKNHIRFVAKNGHRRNSVKIGNRLKGSFVCFTIVATYVILWFPFFLRNLLLLTKIYNPAVHGPLLTQVALYIGATNSLADPLTFVFLSVSVMSEIKRVASSLTYKKSRDSVSVVYEQN